MTGKEVPTLKSPTIQFTLISMVGLCGAMWPGVEAVQFSPALFMLITSALTWLVYKFQFIAENSEKNVGFRAHSLARIIVCVMLFVAFTPKSEWSALVDLLLAFVISIWSDFCIGRLAGPRANMLWAPQQLRSRYSVRASVFEPTKDEYESIRRARWVVFTSTRPTLGPKLDPRVDDVLLPLRGMDSPARAMPWWTFLWRVLCCAPMLDVIQYQFLGSSGVTVRVDHLTWWLFGVTRKTISLRETNS